MQSAAGAMTSPDRRRPQLQIELDDDLITNTNALSLLDASDDLLSPSIMSKPAMRHADDACHSRRGLLLSPAGCSPDCSSVATPAPPSDSAWPTFAPGPLKVVTCDPLHEAARNVVSCPILRQQCRTYPSLVDCLWPCGARRTA